MQCDAMPSDRGAGLFDAQGAARRAARREAQFAATKAGRLMQTMTRLAKDQNPLALAFG